ncbi:Uncharacterized protein ACO02O_10818 [Dirofilaria immitis]
MVSSCYLGFGRKPGLKGNSIYYTMDEDFTDSTMTTRPIKKMYEESMLYPTKGINHPNTDDITSTGDYRRRNISSGSNTFISALGINHNNRTECKPTLQNEIMEKKDKNEAKYILSVYAAPTLCNTRDIIDNDWQDDNDETDKCMHTQQTDNITTMADTVTKIMPYQQIEMQSVESTYINMPNLYNCINNNDYRHYYNIRSPKMEKYVIEASKEGDEFIEHKILKAKNSYKKIQSSQQFSSHDDHTSENISNTYTACNIDINAINSEYVFNIENVDNIDEEFSKSNKSNEMEEMYEISAEEEKLPNSCTSKTDAASAKYTMSTDIASEKQCIESYYNASDLNQWNVY